MPRAVCSGGAESLLCVTGVELSQAELMKRAFAGDDVQADFEAAKAAEVEEELPKKASAGKRCITCSSKHGQLCHCQCTA